MSQFTRAEIACPHCGEVAPREVALTIGGHELDEHLAALRAGTFQRYTCGACRQRYVVDTPFVVLDFEAKRLLYQFPAAEEPRWRARQALADTSYKHTLIDNAPPVVEELREGLTRRTVFGLRALVEKLVILDAGLDDSAVEALKLAMLRDGGPWSIRAGDRLRLHGTTDGALVFHAVAVEGDDRELPAYVEVPRERYEGIATDPAWRDVRASVGAGESYVDVGRILFDGGVAPAMPEWA